MNSYINTTEKKTLFERIGGMDAVNKAVDIFYQKVLKDESINFFFNKTDMNVQAKKLKTFLAYAFGAPMIYTGNKLRDSHSHMNITEKHFITVAGHLVDTLEELKISQDLIAEVVGIVASTKNDILNKS